MTMFDVVIDSSIYRSDPKREKAAFRAFTRLCKGKKAKLHIPEYVKREFLSQQKELIESDIQGIRSAANAILRRTKDEKLVAYATKIIAEADKIRPTTASRTMQEFTKWTAECQAIEYRVKPNHAKRVTDDYFNGAVPFAKVKNRLDIPDSFIWQSVCDIAKNRERLYLIANDGALSKAAETLTNVISFKNLETFIESGECQRALAELTTEVIANNITRAKRLLTKQTGWLEVIVERDIDDALTFETVTDDSIPDGNNSGLIVVVDSPQDLLFDFNKIEYYGGSEIGIPFEVYVECEVNYTILKADYFSLSAEKLQHIRISEHSEQYFGADEQYRIHVEGILSVELQSDKLENDSIGDDEIMGALMAGDHKMEIKEKSVIPWK